MRTCYLHIGTHKTGTTSIQVALSKHRDQLAVRDFLYPRSGIPEPHFGHHDIAGEIYNGPSNLADCENINALLDEIRSTDRDVILSAEGFGFAIHHRERFAAFLQRLRQFTPRIVFVVYFRDQVSYTRSLYFTLLTIGYHETFDTYVSTILHEQTVRIRKAIFNLRYSDVIDLLPAGDEIEITVRPYASVAVTDFLSILGLEPADIAIMSEPVANPAPPLANAMLKFFANRRHRSATASEASTITTACASLSETDVDMTGVSRKLIVAALDESNRIMNARFGLTLQTTDTEAAETCPTDRIHLEHLFSEAMLLSLDAVKQDHRRGTRKDDVPFQHPHHDNSSDRATSLKPSYFGPNHPYWKDHDPKWLHTPVPRDAHGNIIGAET